MAADPGAWAGEDPDGAARRFITTDDAAVTRRTRALAATRPIVDLERNKSSYDGDHWDDVDLSSLAVAVIDQVTLQMGISRGMTLPDAVAFTADEAARQAPHLPADTCQVVARRVVDTLIGGSDPFQFDYITVTDDGPQRRTRSFRLLYEQFDAAGEVHLRATEDAINVLVTGLDIDVESAQVAAEAQMRALIARGAITSAVEAARQAEYRSAEYLESIAAVIRDTRVDPDAYDWVHDVPTLLNRALDHVADRISGERELLVAIDTRREDIPDPAMRAQSNRLAAMIGNCLRRHTDLQRHILTARRELRAAQDERFATATLDLRRAHLEDDLLAPMLTAAAVAVADVADDLVTRFGPALRTHLPELVTIVEETSHPTREPATGDPVPDPVFDPDTSPPWWHPYYDAVDDLLAGLDRPTLLSDLLAAVDTGTTGDDGLDRDLLLAALTHAAYEKYSTALVGDAVSPGRVLLAVRDGQPLTYRHVRGDDLLLVPAALDVPTPAPAADPGVLL